jgi:hypothetical protein
MRRSHRLLLGSLAAGATLSLALAVGAVAAEPATSPLDRLNVWEGHWKFQSERKETPFSHAESEAGEGTCAWQPGHGYMICNFLGDAVDPEEGIRPDNLVIFYYSQAEKAYKHTFMAHEGGPLESTTTIDGDTWRLTYQVPRRSGGTADVRDTYIFGSAEVSLKTEVSIDKGAHWTEISHTALTKVS